MIIIPINEDTLPIVAALNDGFSPKILQGIETVFIHMGKDKPGQVLATEDVETLLGSMNYVPMTVNIVVVPEDSEETPV